MTYDFKQDVEGSLWRVRFSYAMLSLYGFTTEDAGMTDDDIERWHKDYAEAPLDAARDFGLKYGLQRINKENA